MTAPVQIGHTGSEERIGSVKEVQKLPVFIAKWCSAVRPEITSEYEFPPNDNAYAIKSASHNDGLEQNLAPELNRLLALPLKMMEAQNNCQDLPAPNQRIDLAEKDQKRSTPLINSDDHQSVKLQKENEFRTTSDLINAQIANLKAINHSIRFKSKVKASPISSLKIRENQSKSSWENINHQLFPAEKSDPPTTIVIEFRKQNPPSSYERVLDAVPVATASWELGKKMKKGFHQWMRRKEEKSSLVRYPERFPKAKDQLTKEEGEQKSWQDLCAELLRKNHQLTEAASAGWAGWNLCREVKKEFREWMEQNYQLINRGEPKEQEVQNLFNANWLTSIVGNSENERKQAEIASERETIDWMQDHPESWRWKGIDTETLKSLRIIFNQDGTIDAGISVSDEDTVSTSINDEMAATEKKTESPAAPLKLNAEEKARIANYFHDAISLSLDEFEVENVLRKMKESKVLTFNRCINQLKALGDEVYGLVEDKKTIDKVKKQEKSLQEVLDELKRLGYQICLLTSSSERNRPFKSYLSSIVPLNKPSVAPAA